MVLATMVVGCARSAAPGGTTPVAQEERERIATLERETRRRAEEVRELESQLALARARAAAPRTETVRIGDTTARPQDEGFVFFEDEGTSWDEPPAEVLEDEGDDEAPEQASGPRPVLRLHEERGFEMPAGLPALEPAPLPSSGTLPARVAAGGWRTLDPQPVSAPPPSPPVAAVPFPTAVAPTPSFVSPAPSPLPPSVPPNAAPRVDPSTEAYGRALGLLRERRVSEALRAFDTFLADHGGSSLAPAARYWRAEALYVLRRYGEAQAAFDAYLVAHPRDARAADALLKLGLCHEHMGDRAAALRTYERLRREHPSSVAARLASREDA